MGSTIVVAALYAVVAVLSAMAVGVASKLECMLSWAEVR